MTEAKLTKKPASEGGFFRHIRLSTLIKVARIERCLVLAGGELSMIIARRFVEPQAFFGAFFMKIAPVNSQILNI